MIGPSGHRKIGKIILCSDGPMYRWPDDLIFSVSVVKICYRGIEMEPPEPLKSSPRVVEMGSASKPWAPHLSDHLANERTYLAYLRTSIALIGFGITINRFSIYLTQSKTLPERALQRWDMAGVGRVGFGMVIAGLILLAWATIHFTQVSNGIERGTYRPNVIVPWIITAAVILGGGLSLMWLFPH